MTVQPPAPPYLGPAKFHGPKQNLNPLQRIVIHGTVSPCVEGGARTIANYFARTVTRPSSAHYVVDPGEEVQVVGDHQVAFHAPPNADTIGVEHCDPVAGPAARWNDANHVAMLKRSAKLVARLCLAYDLPIRRVGPVQLKLGMRGITGHADVSKAWRETSHTDPGDGFPWAKYLRMVKAEAKTLKGAPATTPVVPIPVITPHAPCMNLVTANIRNNPDMAREHVREDMATVTKLGGVICWQEVAEPDDWDDLSTTLPEPTWAHIGLGDECPISVRRSTWTVVRSGRMQLHAGKAGVSPHRVAQWVELQRRGNTFTKVGNVVVVNTHWVSGAFGTPGQVAEAWRAAMWATAHEGMSKLVAQFLAEGLTVVGGGDFNRSGAFPGFAPDHVWLLNGGLDHLWACPSPEGAQVRLLAVDTIGTEVLNTDHPARMARIELTPSRLTGKVHLP